MPSIIVQNANPEDELRLVIHVAQIGDPVQVEVTRMHYGKPVGLSKYEHGLLGAVYSFFERSWLLSHELSQIAEFLAFRSEIPCTFVVPEDSQSYVLLYAETDWLRVFARALDPGGIYTYKVYKLHTAEQTVKRDLLYDEALFEAWKAARDYLYHQGYEGKLVGSPDYWQLNLNGVRVSWLPPQGYMGKEVPEPVALYEARQIG